MDITHMIATRGTCDRRQVGAVIVKNNEVVSMGYNGSPAGTAHCDQVGHLMENGHCIRTIHAEQNALLRASYKDLDGATLYVTDYPCVICAKMIANSGITSLHFARVYRPHPYAANLLDHLMPESLREMHEIG